MTINSVRSSARAITVRQPAKPSPSPSSDHLTPNPEGPRAFKPVQYKQSSQQGRRQPSAHELQLAPEHGSSQASAVAPAHSVIAAKLARLSAPRPAPARSQPAADPSRQESLRALSQLNALLKNLGQAARSGAVNFSGLAPFIERLRPIAASMGTVEGLPSTSIVGLMLATAHSFAPHQARRPGRAAAVIRTLGKLVQDLERCIQHAPTKTLGWQTAAICSWSSLYWSNEPRALKDDPNNPYFVSAFGSDARDTPYPTSPAHDFSKLTTQRIAGIQSVRYDVLLAAAVAAAVGRLSREPSRKVIIWGFMVASAIQKGIYISESGLFAKGANRHSYAQLGRQFGKTSGPDTVARGDAAQWFPPVRYAAAAAA